MEFDDYTEESRVKFALDFIERNPGSKIATVARQFHVERTKLYRRLRGVGLAGGHHATNARLNEAEEKGLCRLIERLDEMNIPVRKQFVVESANSILGRRLSSAASLGPPQQKSRDKDRQAAEDLSILSIYFSKLQSAISKNGICPESIWNMDEAGFQIGIGKDHMAITRRCGRSIYLGIPANRESATAIEAISAIGEYTPAFLILSGKVHQSSWYKVPQLANDTIIGVSDSGYSNDRLSLDWLMHFDRHTKKKAKGKYRLLILDGFGSHHTYEFIEYADDNDIILFGLPPRLTHLLQPLDVVVFQPLKHWHTEALDVLIRDGAEQITKIDFLSIIQDIRKIISIYRIQISRSASNERRV